jgi:hypothetical protein
MKHELIPCVFVSGTSLEEGYLKKGNLIRLENLLLGHTNLKVEVKPHYLLNRK